jgi:hypothetical protein
MPKLVKAWWGTGSQRLGTLLCGLITASWVERKRKAGS